MSESNALSLATQATGISADADEDAGTFVSFTIGGQLFGVPVTNVQDVLTRCDVTPVPLAPPEVAGSLNLRGRIVTAIDVRQPLGLEPRASDDSYKNIVVEHGGELYSLMVDGVGEVLSLSARDKERNPPTLDPKFAEFSSGIYRLENQLLVELDVGPLLRQTADA